MHSLGIDIGASSMKMILLLSLDHDLDDAALSRLRSFLYYI